MIALFTNLWSTNRPVCDLKPRLFRHGDPVSIRNRCTIGVFSSSSVYVFIVATLTPSLRACHIALLFYSFPLSDNAEAFVGVTCTRALTASQSPVAEHSNYQPIFGRFIDWTSKNNFNPCSMKLVKVRHDDNSYPSSWFTNDVKIIWWLIHDRSNIVKITNNRLSIINHVVNTVMHAYKFK